MVINRIKCLRSEDREPLMKNLLAVSAALIVCLCVVSGLLWRDLRASRLLVADMRGQLAQQPAQGPALPPEPSQEPLLSTESKDPVGRVQGAPVTQPVPPAVVVAGPVNLSQASEETTRAAAMAASDQTATSRVMAWRDRLALAGQTLTTPQLQALNAAATSELRRETEESLQRMRTAGPTDLDTAARMKEEAINRQNETNLRILQMASSELTADQVGALRTQFESGHAARLAAARAEREAAGMSR
jgi:hypothetical protein